MLLTNLAYGDASGFVFGLSGDYEQVYIIPQALSLDEVDPPFFGLSRHHNSSGTSACLPQ